MQQSFRLAFVSLVSFIVAGCGIAGYSQTSVVRSNGVAVGVYHADQSPLGGSQSSDMEMHPDCKPCRDAHPKNPEACDMVCYGYSSTGYGSGLGGANVGAVDYASMPLVAPPMPLGQGPMSASASPSSQCGPSGCVSNDRFNQTMKHVTGAIKTVNCKVDKSCGKK